MDRQKPRTNGKRKHIQTKSHKEAYITKSEKGNKNLFIYIKGREQSNQ